MNRLVYLLALMCLLSRCGIFKTKKSIQLTDVLNKQETDIRNEQRLLLINDSLGEDLVVEIVPIGIFSYSLTEGFKGSGSAIKITDRKNGTIKMLEKTNFANINQQSEKKTATKTMTDTMVKRNGFKLGIGFYCILGCLALGFLLWFWWKWYAPTRHLK
jgi:hypothetical protein